jgi:hypothetical protein
MRKVFANTVAVIMLAPIWPFYGAMLFGNWAIMDRKWSTWLFDKTENVLMWGERG